MHRLHLPSRLLCWAVCYDERGRELPSHRNSVSKHDGAPFVSYPQQLDVGSSQFNTRGKKRRKTEHSKICRVTNVLITQSTDNTANWNIKLKRRWCSPRLACPVLTFTRAYISPALLPLAKKETALDLNHPFPKNTSFHSTSPNSLGSRSKANSGCTSIFGLQDSFVEGQFLGTWDHFRLAFFILSHS